MTTLERLPHPLDVVAEVPRFESDSPFISVSRSASIVALALVKDASAARIPSTLSFMVSSLLSPKGSGGAAQTRSCQPWAYSARSSPAEPWAALLCCPARNRLRTEMRESFSDSGHGRPQSWRLSTQPPVRLSGAPGRFGISQNRLTIDAFKPMRPRTGLRPPRTRSAPIASGSGRLGRY